MAPAARERVRTWCEKAQGKEWKPTPKPAPGYGGAEMPPVSGYNADTRLFHIQSSSTCNLTMDSNSNQSFGSIEHSNDFGSFTGSGSECGSISKNGSCSGESEDQSLNLNGKDRKGQLPGGIGGRSDNKRDKIRYKNEKRHQRQKERRAQEHRDRCVGYLMSRKLEALSHQLMAMGFSSDRATMALILNKGVVEDSIAYLLEGGEGQLESDWNADGFLKIDISKELSRIADLESTFKYLRVEIDRAIVAFEGDLDEAAEWLYDRHSGRGRCAPADYGSGVQDTAEERIPVVGTALSYAMTVQVQEYQSDRSGELGNEDRTFSTSKGRPRSFTDWQRLSACVDGKMSNIVVRNPPQPTPRRPHPGRHMFSRAPPPQDNGYPPGREQGWHLTARDSIVAPQFLQPPISPPSNVRSTSVSPFLSPSNWINRSVSGAFSPSSVLSFNGPRAGDLLFKGVPSSKSKRSIYSPKAAEEHRQAQPLHEFLSDLLASDWASDRNSLGAAGTSRPAAGVSASTSQLRTLTAPRFLSGWGSGLPGGLADWSIWVSNGTGNNAIDWNTAAAPSDFSVRSP